MKIYALKAPAEEKVDKDLTNFLTTSFKEGKVKFGWSYEKTADLRSLKDKSWKEMTPGEKEAWKKAHFLLNIKDGDWVVQINLPKKGKCIAGRVDGGYDFEDNDVGDFRHTIKIDTSSIVEFDRNDDAILPVISSRLKLQGKYWTIKYPEAFEKSLENVKNNTSSKEHESSGIFHLKRELQPKLEDITKEIQRSHPGGKLEHLLAEVFKQMPNVTEVKEYGQHKGWKTDHGADIIVNYETGLPIEGLYKEEKLVVQVKSYENTHKETNAVKQLGMGIQQFDADAGVLITTGESSPELEEAVERLRNDLNENENTNNAKTIPISLVAGKDVASFVLRFGGDFLLES